MQVDPDLVRRILLAVEATPANQHVGNIEFPDVDENVIYEHIEVLADAGLVEAAIQPREWADTAFITRLSPASRTPDTSSSPTRGTSAFGRRRSHS